MKLVTVISKGPEYPTTTLLGRAYGIGLSRIKNLCIVQWFLDPTTMHKHKNNSKINNQFQQKKPLKSEA